jgi:hypothetical protein
MAAPAELGSEWLPECAAFYAHWRSLRRDSLMPTSEAFLDDSPAEFMPNLYIVELTSEGAMVRFHGTELATHWGRDFTGVEIHDIRPPDFKARSVSNMHNVVGHPCGILLKLYFSTSKGRKMQSDLIQLPLGVQPGRPPRLVCYALAEASRAWEETVARYLETLQLKWLDIGAGVPAAAPFDLAS